MFSKQLKQYSPHSSAKFQPVLNVFCTGTPLVMAPVDAFFFGVLNPELCNTLLL